MTNTNDVRWAHEVLDGMFAGRILSRENEQLLRSFLPELPAQMSLEALRQDVHDVWAGVHGNEWPDDMYCDLENWLYKLHKQLRGLEPAKSAHPEFLETEADYQNAPEGTIAACEDGPPWHKFESVWLSTAAYEGNSAEAMAGVIRCALRWGWGE